MIFLLGAALMATSRTSSAGLAATPVDGVIATYRRPFSAVDHEAIGRDNIVFGVVHDGVVVADRP